MLRKATVPQHGQTSHDVLQQRAIAWKHRPVLRLVYRQYFSQMAAEFVVRSDRGPNRHGRVVEIGGGAGHFKEFYPDVVVTDLVPNEFIDLAVDALRLPFADQSVDNLVLQDVIHHLPLPLRFFAEAQRVLTPGGRLVMTEPYISAVSGICYRTSHPEPVNMQSAIFADEAAQSSGAAASDPIPIIGEGPFASNQAVPTLLFFKHWAEFQKRFPQFVLKRRQTHSMMLYPLSGGFSGPVLMPHFAAHAAQKFERLLAPLARWLAFRMLIVLEKSPAVAPS